MLLKWLFTILAILWLIQALRPYFTSGPGIRQKPPSPDKNNKAKRNDDDYIDYEEIK